MRKLPLALTVSAGTLALDQITKFLAVRFISPAHPVDVLPFLTLVNVRNTGAAFGMLSSLGNTFFVAATLAAMALVAFLLIRGDEDAVGLSLILGGGLANLIDRLALGHVRDFIDVHAGSLHWPAFNVADSALTVGIALLILNALRSRPRPDRLLRDEKGSP
ncbi:MAG: signal peptidase II [Nitrospirota bacterium]|jgi:signal peptidase II